MCVGTYYHKEGGRVDADLKMAFPDVPHFCPTCKKERAKESVGRYLPNGRQAFLKRSEHDH